MELENIVQMARSKLKELTENKIQTQTIKARIRNLYAIYYPICDTRGISFDAFYLMVKGEMPYTTMRPKSDTDPFISHLPNGEGCPNFFEKTQALLFNLF